MSFRWSLISAALVVACVLALVPHEASAFSVRLRWRAVPDVSGYRLYVRTTGAWSSAIDLGNPSAEANGMITHVEEGLADSGNHSFRLTSYVGATESVPSNEMTLAYAAIAGLLDSDDDGLTDAAEDRDLDMVTDATETDRLRPDTDGDGIGDGTEVAAGTNSLDPNDPPATSGTCAAPVVIAPAGGTVTSVTSGTGTLDGSCVKASNAPEKVFRWTPSVSGLATFETCGATGTAFDTVLYVRRRTCRGTEVGCNDDSGSCATAEPSTYHGSRIAPWVTAGETYFIVVDGFGAASGAFTLRVIPPAPATATPARTVTPVATTTPVRTATHASAASTATPTRTAAQTPASTATRTATPTGVPTPTPTWTATFTATPRPAITATPIPTPTGACAAAAQIPAGGGTFTGTTTGMPGSDVAGSCAATSAAAERVYHWTPRVSGIATISTCSATATTFDTVLYVRKGGCLGGAELACNDDDNGCRTSVGGKAKGSRLSLAVAADQTYVIVVDGADGATGSFLLTVDPPRGSGSVGEGEATPAPGATPTPDDTHAPIALVEAYRCHRLGATRTERGHSTTVHVVDRFGELVGDVRTPRALCIPAVTSDATDQPGEPALTRHALRSERFDPAPEASLRISNVFGETTVFVARPELAQAPALVEPAPPGAGVDADGAGAPHLCYPVRAGDGMRRHRVTIPTTKGEERLVLAGPIRLCIDEEAGRLQVCYRSRRHATRGEAATRMTITTPMSTLTGELRGLREVCVPSSTLYE
ncbi:MAG: hypothetical protein IT293_03380 [Deltaproteobacteria bacterium]|nr:hypothetical protein [Deltaproteobacteria bacterium]